MEIQKKRKINQPSIFNKKEILNFLENYSTTNNYKTIKSPLQHLYTLWKFIIKNPNKNIIDCPNLPKIMYELLPSRFVTISSKIEKIENSSDGNTIKLLIKLQDGKLIETVIMYYDRKNKLISKKSRYTICISSQVGCNMGCSFCATGTMGFNGNLTCNEIIEQLIHALTIKPIKNVVFMGMV